jgi:PAS domain S-box-containing protein
METNKIPMHDDAGRVIGVLGTCQDVTERKRAEEALTRSERQYRDLVETSHDLIWSVDPDGRWTFVNRRGARAIYGYEPEEMIGRPFTEFLSAEQARRDLEVFARIKGGEPVFHYETEHFRKDGTPIILSFNAIPWYAADGQLLGTTGTATDITERKQSEEERRKLEAQFQHAQKMESLGVLAGGIAHDFNNLLTSILGYADLALRELSPGSTAHELIGEVVNGACRAAELTKQMLAYAGKGRFVVESLDLSSLTEDMTRLLQVSISRKCVLKLDLASGLPAVEADAAQLRQVIMNLVINASEGKPSATAAGSLRSAPV